MIERPKLKYGSFCSGIEAATAAVDPLGWENVYLGEIEPFPCAVLAYRHGASRPLRMPDPDEAGISEDDAKARRAAIRALDRITYWGNRVTNYGDMSQIVASELPYADVLVAGTPCQDFSIAGLRAGLAGNRGNLTLTFVRLVHELVALRRIRAVLWENVPDVLNDATNAFGSFLAGLLGHDAPLRSNLVGGKWGRKGVAMGPLGKVAWSVENTEYYGLAQRRERVFVVASFGEMDPVSVLLERRSLHGNPKPSRKAGEEIAGTLTGGARRDGGYGCDDIPLVPDTPRYLGNAEGGATDLPFLTLSNVGKTLNNQTPLVHAPAPVAFTQNCRDEVRLVGGDGSVCGAITADQGARQQTYIAFNARQDPDPTGDVSGPLDASSPQGSAIAYPIDPNALRGDTAAKTPSADATGRVRLRDPGLGIGEDGDPAPTLQASGPSAVAFSLRGREGGAMPEVEDEDIAPALRAAEGGSSRPYVATFWSVRRLTPVECERLMGFADNHTLIPWPTANRKGRDLVETVFYLTKVHGYSEEDAHLLAQTPDGPRYKACGNSKGVTLVREICTRMADAWPVAA